jgi:hypothetical protein
MERILPDGETTKHGDEIISTDLCIPDVQASIIRHEAPYPDGIFVILLIISDFL